VLYRETHNLLEEIAEAAIDGTRKQHMELLTTVPLLIIDDLACANSHRPPPRTS
jgi:DNA replication protein DnaC